MAEVNYVLLISRWAHLTAVIVAIGGAAFTRWVLLPAARESLDAQQHDRLRESVRKRWAMFVYTCITVLLVTGIINLVILVIQPKINPMPYHAIFGVKLLAALGVFFLASALAGRSPGFAKFRQNSRKWLGILLFLALSIVLLSGLLGQVRTAAMAAG